MSRSVNADAAWLQDRLGSLAFEFNHSTIVLTLLALIVAPVLASTLLGAPKGKRLPVVNPPRLFELETRKKFEFALDGMRYLREGRKRFPGQPFVLVSNPGRMTILPPDRAQEVNGKKTLSLRRFFAGHIPFSPPGVGAIDMLDHPREILQNMTKKHLTKRLNTVTEPLASEASFAVRQVIGDKPDWSEVIFYDVALGMVARLSSRVFLGAELCRNPEWLDITENFAIAQNKAFWVLRLYPRFLRPLVYLFEKYSRQMGTYHARGRRLVEPVLAQRRKERQECAAKGIPAPIYNDALEWAETEAGGAAYDPTNLQLILSFVAIHTTTDLVAQTMFHLAANPENITALREEMIEVLAAGGWKKASLARLKLLDSAIKEAQRLKPIMSTSMVRRATADTELEGGIVVRKGELVAVDTVNLVNPAKYENPDKFNMYRFLEMRKNQPGAENTAQLISATPDHLTFGYGKYVCPGRFFAANEIKIILCHLLLKYDWKLAPGTTLEPVYFGTDPLVDPTAKLLCRRRREEMDLDSLEADDAAAE